MRTKRDFYNDITSLTKTAMAKMQELTLEHNEIDQMIRSGKYSGDYLRKELYPKKDALKREIEEIRESANQAAEKLCSDYTEELRRGDDLNPEKLTHDTALFRSGVRLTARDIKAILNRNAGNGTMEQLALRYAADHEIDLGERYLYVGNKNLINEVLSVPTAVKTSLKWPEKESTVYEKLMGESSQLNAVFNVDDGGESAAE